MAIPHLIHIGFPKAGSTFLQEWFARHPEIGYALNALGGFHDLYDVCNYGTTASSSKIRCFVTSFEGLSAPLRGIDVVELAHHLGGTPDPIKPAQERVCQVLRDLFPNGQILIVTRGFKGIIQSGYSQLVKTGSTLLPHEMTSLFESGNNDDDASQKSRAAAADLHNPYDFDYVIALYREAFGAENVIVLPYELLRDNQKQFLGILEERLGISHIDIDLGRLNPSLSPAELYWYPLISRQVRRVANRLGSRGERKVRAWHVEQTLHNRWRRVIKFLERRWPHKKITSADFPVEMYESCRGKAESLRGNPLYAPYGAEYLWE